MFAQTPELRKRNKLFEVTQEISKTPLARRITNFDIFPKTPDYAVTKSKLGATCMLEKNYFTIIVSICVGLILCVLIISEISLFFTSVRKDTLSVDMEAQGKISIFFNITFPFITCRDLHLDVVDQSGAQQLHVHNRVFKFPMTKEGSIIGAERSREKWRQAVQGKTPHTPADDPESPFYCGNCYAATAYNRGIHCCNSCDDVKEAYKRAGLKLPALTEFEQCLIELSDELPGCNVFGAIDVSKVAGNFHFAPGRSFSQEHEHNVHHVHEFNPLLINRFNATHRIHTLSFGEKIPHVKYPLEETEAHSEEGVTVHKYFIKVVPTTYRTGWLTRVQSYQYSYTKHIQSFDPQKVMALPGVFFVYEPSPIRITYLDTGEPFLHFLVRLCAVVGGVFTVFGMMSRLVGFLVGTISKKKN